MGIPIEHELAVSLERLIETVRAAADVNRRAIHHYQVVRRELDLARQACDSAEQTLGQARQDLILAVEKRVGCELKDED